VTSALALLGDASGDEHSLLSAIRFQPKRAVLHTDASWRIDALAQACRQQIIVYA
jgi:predicted NAD/FAD-binding protein